MSGTTSKVPLWTPDSPHETNVFKFIGYVNKRHGLKLKSYHDLYQWSVAANTMQKFWRAAYQFLEIAAKGHECHGDVIQESNSENDSVQLFPPPKWFPDETFNLAEMMLRNRSPNDIAVHFAREGVAGIEQVTWASLRGRTEKVYDALVASGLVKDDIVASVVSNSVDAMVLCLATLAIGATWSSVSPDLGSQTILDRFLQIKPKFVFADDGFVYAGTLTKLEDKIVEWSQQLTTIISSVQDVIIIPYCKLAVDCSKIAKGITWEDFLARCSGRKLSFQSLPFSHQAFILFSSGTTGPPKCIVHSAGGVALKVKVDMQLQNDVRKSDTVFQYTTTAWVMWVLNFVNLSCGASMLLYDGSPFYPGRDTLLKLAETVGVTVFGTSPKYLTELMKRNITPRSHCKLDRLRIVTSTGAVLPTDIYDWFYAKGFDRKVHLISMSGGTDISGCFVGGTPLLPVYSGEIQAKCLGMAVKIFDATETVPVEITRPGVPGEMVCHQPFPSQPTSFFGAGGMDRYRSSYFERYGNGVWCQGDFIQVVEDTQGIIMLGRSDGVLNPSGVRFGSSDIYSVTNGMSQIADAICVGQRRKADTDERVLLFVKLNPGSVLDASFVAHISSAIENKFSRRYVPRHIFEVDDIPYTLNGKKCELNVKQIISGLKGSVSGTVANPECLGLYEKYARLRDDGSVAPVEVAKL